MVGNSGGVFIQQCSARKTTIERDAVLCCVAVFQIIFETGSGKRKKKMDEAYVRN